jgi:restriction system protein
MSRRKAHSSTHDPTVALGSFFFKHPKLLGLLLGILVILSAPVYLSTYPVRLDATSIGFILLALITPVLALVVWLILRERQTRRLRALQIADIDNMNGIDFEHYVARLLQNQGFSVTVTRASGDLGVDVLAQKPAIKYSVQVKRQSDPVSRRAISDAVAGKFHYGCSAAMVVTNSFFTPGAKTLANSTSCALIDRDKLAEWILAFHNSRAVPKNS